LPAKVVKDEVGRSRFLLEDKLGVKVEGFAYPFGYWDQAARAAVADAGFGYAVAVADLMTAPGDDALTLPRLTVNASIGVAGLARVLGSQDRQPSAEGGTEAGCLARRSPDGAVRRR